LAKTSCQQQQHLKRKVLRWDGMILEGKAGKRQGSCSTANEKVYVERDAGN